MKKMVDYTAKDGAEWEGAIPDEKGEYLVCKECGDNNLRLVSHFDGKKTYGYFYNCGNGHCITRTFRRKIWPW